MVKVIIDLFLSTVFPNIFERVVYNSVSRNMINDDVFLEKTMKLTLSFVLTEKISPVKWR